MPSPEQLEIVACRDGADLLSERNVSYPIPMVGEEPATEFRLIPVGDIALADGPVFTLRPEDVKPIVDAFNSRGNDFHGDYEHASEQQGADMPPNGSPASCRCKLEARPDGIWCVNAVWTPRAKEYLKNGEYWAFSPVFGRNEAGLITSVRSFGLTNDPRINNLHPLVRCKVVPFHEYPLDDSDTWDGDRQRKAWRKACSSDGSGDWDTIAHSKYGAMFAYVKDDGDRPGDYLLPHHSVFSGQLRTSRKGVEAAAAAIDGARGGAKIPESDIAGVKHHLAEHFRQWHEKAPWDRTEQAKAPDGFVMRRGRAKAKGAVSLVATVNRSGKMLLGKRADSGKWAHPGGHAEQNETPEGTAIRELHEETGLHPLSGVEKIGEANADGGARLSIFKAIVDGTPTAENDPDNEFSEFRWVDPTLPIPEDMVLHHAKDAVMNALKSHSEAAQSAATQATKKAAEEKHMDELMKQMMASNAAEAAEAAKRHGELMASMGKQSDNVSTMCKSMDTLCGVLAKSVEKPPAPTDDDKKKMEAEEKEKAKAKHSEEIEACRGFCDGNIGPGFTKSDALQVMGVVESGKMTPVAARNFVTAKRSHGALKELVDAGLAVAPVVSFGFDAEIVEKCKRESPKAKETFEFASKLAGAEITPQSIDAVTVEVCRSLGVQHHRSSNGEAVIDFDPVKCAAAWKANQEQVDLRKKGRADQTYIHRGR